MLIKAIAGVAVLGVSSLWFTPAADETQEESGKYKVDPGHSSVMFRVQHLGAAYFYGRFNEMSGTVLVDHETPADMMVRMTVPVASIDTNSEGRDEHLMGPDFFDAKQFPQVTFESTSVEESGPGEFEITGDFTMHGVTKEVTLTATHSGHGQVSERFGYRSGYEAKLTLNRSDYGISYMPGGLGEEVTVLISLELTKG